MDQEQVSNSQNTVQNFERDNLTTGRSVNENQSKEKSQF